MHDCLVPITAWIGNVFDSIRRTERIPAKVLAVDMRNLLLLLPFCCITFLRRKLRNTIARISLIHYSNVWNKMIKTFEIIIKIRNAETATVSCGGARLGQPRSVTMLDPTPVVDPSNECIGTVLLFMDWYMVYRRRLPPKDEVDIQDLQSLSLRYLLIVHIVFRLFMLLRVLSL